MPIMRDDSSDSMPKDIPPERKEKQKQHFFNVDIVAGALFVFEQGIKY